MRSRDVKEALRKEPPSTCTVAADTISRQVCARACCRNLPKVPACAQHRKIMFCSGSPNITKVAFACTKCALCYMAQPAHCTSCFQGFSGGPIHFCFCRSFTWSFMGPLGHSRFTGVTVPYCTHCCKHCNFKTPTSSKTILSISFHLIRQPLGRLMFGPGSWERDSYVALIEILRRHRLSRF